MEEEAYEASEEEAQEDEAEIEVKSRLIEKHWIGCRGMLSLI